MQYIVYKITNKKNGKIYIGKHQTEDINDGYMGSGKLLIRAIKKYGIDNFEKEILFKCKSEKKMNEKEREIVTEEFCDRDDNYNLCPGGNGGFGYINSKKLNVYGKNGQIGFGGENLSSGGIISDDVREKARLANLGNEYWLGRKHSKESLEKMKGHKRQSGSKNSQYGKSKSEETKRKISETLKKKFSTYSSMGEQAIDNR